MLLRTKEYTPAEAVPTSEPARPVRRPGRTRAGRALRLFLLLPPFALAFGSLFEPWARARVTLVWGVARSPEATIMLAGGLGVAFVTAALVTWTGRWRRLAGPVHFAMGLLLGFVAWQAYGMVKEAGVKAIGILPLVSVRPGLGLRAFTLAATLLGTIGAVEWVWVLAQRVSRRRRPT